MMPPVEDKGRDAVARALQLLANAPRCHCKARLTSETAWDSVHRDHREDTGGFRLLEAGDSAQSPNMTAARSIA